MTYEITASPYFKLSLKRLIHFMTVKYSSKLATETKRQIRNTIEENLPNNPYIAPISDRLVDLGIKEYRQYQMDEHNILFYQVNEDKKLIVLLTVIDSRQSIQKLLAEIMLIS